MVYKNKAVLDDLIISLKNGFKLTDEGYLSMFLGDQFNKHNHDEFELTQPHPIKRIIETLGLNDDSKMNDTPASAMLHKDNDGKKRTQSRN